jgi:site-specific recombinase XerD
MLLLRITEKEAEVGRPTSRVTSVQVSGPLAIHAAGFHSGLIDAGYTPLSAVNQMRLMAQLSRWLDAAGLVTPELTDERVDEFLAARRAERVRWSGTRRALAPLLEFLAAHDSLPESGPPPAPSAAGALLDSFQRYLVDERGLASSTACAYVLRAARFLASCAADGGVADLSAADVTRAVLAESAALSVGSAQLFVVALRCFLRFCCVEGLVEADLSAAAMAVTGRRRSSLPKGISRADAEALLRSCDRRRAIGRRDYAVIVVLLRLGLRAGEVASLTLDDIDWRAGEIVVHGKGRRDERLPLPGDVGGAIAGYLRRGRPKSTRREVFLSAIAPVSGLGRGAVSSIVRRACVRAGAAPVGAHRLRHTMACEMMRAGVPLPEIGQVLRHRGVVSTAVYARVDVDQLRPLARPWPAGAER